MRKPVNRESHLSPGNQSPASVHSNKEARVRVLQHQPSKEQLLRVSAGPSRDLVSATCAGYIHHGSGSAAGLFWNTTKAVFVVLPAFIVVF